MRLLLIPLLILASCHASALTDPTRPSGFESGTQEQSPQKQFSLASIVIGDDRRVAVIDGVARSEGHRFEGVRIRRILADRVELVDQGRVRVLRLEPLPQVRSSQ